MESVAYQLEINADDQRTFGPCDCCGNMTSRVWGYVRQGEKAVSAYFVEWTPGHQDRAANFDLIVGSWGDETTADERVGVALAFRNVATGPGFMVVDSDRRSVGKSSLVGRSLTRQQVLDSRICQDIFVMCDAILSQDHRLTVLP